MRRPFAVKIKNEFVNIDRYGQTRQTLYLDIIILLIFLIDNSLFINVIV